MGVYWTNCRRKVVKLFIFQILKSNNILTKMASFKILLVEALVAFIGSTDAALKCMVKPAGTGPAVSTDCGVKKSCKIEATITTFEPAAVVVTNQACDDEVLGANTTSKFDVPTTLKNQENN